VTELLRGIVRSAICPLAGAGLAALAWMALLPWDLSEVDKLGRPLPKGGEDYAAEIALVAVVVAVMGLTLLASSKTRRGAGMFAAGGLWTWAALFGWRAAVSRVTGANLFVVPLIVAVVPAALALPVIIGAAGNWLETRRPPSP
jgi:hypothetical protein